MFWNRGSEIYDLDKIGKYAHGVGPAHQWIMNWMPDASDPFQMKTHALDWNIDSPFVDKMHSMDVLVVPWTIKDDILLYAETPYQEVELYFKKGVDGVITEFPLTTIQSFDKLI